ncbi:hypothetical protein CC78DRAFT_537484 [Lojkania enalia]|uniref:Cyclochlorotine biosynthesis protein O n=1 Tax=Lojkania enalia TaxID=147567 RepID=A0A9P4JXR2_9PLEO|nr:hypothetical protein CC78DRAFT_537484 [Didymosphaeria enalia]
MREIVQRLEKKVISHLELNPQSPTVTMLHEEEEFLLDSHEGKPIYRREGWYSRLASSRWVGIYVLVLHIVLAVLLFEHIYTFFTSTWDGKPFIIFPELRSLGHVVQTKHATNHSAYTMYSGPPNEANAAAWEHLLQPLYFNASEQELQASGTDPSASVKVKGGGYIAALGVYHEIHCLNKLRYFLYASQRPSNQSEDDAQISTDHLDHCLEVLRMSAMCHADLSLYTFRWPADPQSKFLEAHSTSPKMCVDWTQLESYAWGRKIGLTPTLVRETPDGQPN